MPRSPETAMLARLYRRIPARARRRINAHVSVERRARAKDALATSPPHDLALRAGDALHRLGNKQLHAVPDTLLTFSGTTRRVARVHKSGMTPLEARRSNLLEVQAALENASIPYFAVRGRDDRKAVLGVDAQHTERTQAVLIELCGRTAGYYATIYGRRSRQKTVLRPGTKPPPRSEQPGVALRVVWFRTDPSASMLFGERYACEVEFWQQDGLGALLAPRPNRVTGTFAVDEPKVEVSDTMFTRLASAAGEPLPAVTTVPSFAHPLPDDIRFPIDAVFTWVDGADEEWRRRRAEVAETPYHEEADNESRYVSRDELRFALRSIDLYAPWIRTIYLVTDQQVPTWLNTECPDVRVVDHRDIFADTGVLPTFNSHAIESQLHHIEGLSEQFLYFNDDMMLASEVAPQVFFHANGLSKFFQSTATVPQGSAQDSDVPVTIAAKNNRAAMQPIFGTSPAKKMKHAPYALRRSVLAEIEERFPEEYQRTMGARVRSPSDLSLVSNFYHYYAFQTGRAIPGRIRYRYIDLAQPDASRILDAISRRRNQQALCLNTTVAESEPSTQRALRALEDCFPLPSRFER